MTDFKPVQDALAAGADPAMLCATCPWDRNCITPPSTTRAEVDARIAKATADDEANAAKRRANGEPEAMPIGGLLTAIMMGGRDTAASICPVFAARLRSSAGRTLVDGVKAQMSSWDDEAVA